MNLTKIYKRIVLISPYIEVLFRWLYWKNISKLKRFRPSKSKIHPQISEGFAWKFESVKTWLQSEGVEPGGLVVVHSSYDAIANCGLKPNEVIKELRGMIGEQGTLAMPAIRLYKELPKPEEWLKTDMSKIVCKYDPRRTPVKSGLLPSMLMREKGAEISMHPLNTMTAVGPLAKAMMEHNMEGEKPSPHGPNSSWKFCVDHDAMIVALGVPMIHHLTIAHVSDEAYDRTPFDDWYDEKQFDIVMPDKQIVRRVVRDRKPKWGMIHDAEMNFGKDLEKAGIMHLTSIDGISVGVLRAKDLIAFMRDRKNKAYPYYKIF